ncbi:MAG TPA: hypothetical protein VG826_01700 [Pirellulales bacterium]|nr:hypothetical protein [Pirellulales bacterium]
MRGSVVRMVGPAALAAWVLCASPGCSVLQPQSMRIDSAASAYQGVTITYRVDSGQLSEPLTVARIAGQQVTQQSVPSSPYPDHSVARLSIRYPHPDGKAEYALAELVVETRTPPNAQIKKSTWQQWVDTFAATARDILPGVKLSDDVREAWAMDIAKNDLDRVVAGMSQSGYFVNPPKASPGVELAARIDGFQANKRWSREPELDVLMERIRQEGQLVSYVHPVESSSVAVAAGNARTPARFVSQEEDGPSLMPAGPQNQAYTNPSENRAPARTPRYTPPPTSFTPAPFSPAPNTPRSIPAPPAAPMTVPDYPRSAMPNLLHPPAAAPTTLPPADARSKARALRTPQPNSPQPNSPQSKSPQSKSPQPRRPANPLAKPEGRWQYPPQYRRQSGQASPSLAPGAAGQPPAAAPQGASRDAAQQRQQRMPWRRPAATNAQQQPAASPSPTNAARNSVAPRSRPQRNSGAPGQPPSAGRLPPRYPATPGYQPPYQPPARYPSAPYGSAQNDPAPNYPQTSTPTGNGSPPGIPQPPQLGSRPSNTY